MKRIKRLFLIVGIIASCSTMSLSVISGAGGTIVLSNESGISGSYSFSTSTGVSGKFSLNGSSGGTPTLTVGASTAFDQNTVITSNSGFKLVQGGVTILDLPGNVTVTAQDIINAQAAKGVTQTVAGLTPVAAPTTPTTPTTPTAPVTPVTPVAVPKTIPVAGAEMNLEDNKLEVSIPRSKMDLDLFNSHKEELFTSMTNEQVTGLTLGYSGGLKTDFNDDPYVGYEGDSNSFTLGYSYSFEDKATIGASYSYSNANVDYKNQFTGVSEDIDAHQFSVYGSYNLPMNFKVLGTVGYSFNSHDLSYYDNTGYDSNIFDMDIRGAYNYEIENFKIVPFIGLGFTTLNESEYDNLNIASNTETGFNGKVGLDFVGKYQGFEFFLGGFYEARFGGDSLHGEKDFGDTAVIRELDYGNDRFVGKVGLGYQFLENFDAGIAYYVDDSTQSIKIGFGYKF